MTIRMTHKTSLQFDLSMWRAEFTYFNTAAAEPILGNLFTNLKRNRMSGILDKDGTHNFVLLTANICENLANIMKNKSF